MSYGITDDMTVRVRLVEKYMKLYFAYANAIVASECTFSPQADHSREYKNLRTGPLREIDKMRADLAILKFIEPFVPNECGWDGKVIDEIEKRVTLYDIFHAEEAAPAKL